MCQGSSWCSVISVCFCYMPVNSSAGYLNIKKESTISDFGPCYCPTQSQGGSVRLLWSLGVPWSEMPEHSRLFMSFDWCRLHRVWAQCLGSWWDHPCLIVSPAYLSRATDWFNFLNRRANLPLFLLSELLMWGWSVWAPGKLPGSSSRNIQM